MGICLDIVNEIAIKMPLDISIVIPLYNSSLRVFLLHQRLIRIMSADSDYEIIFVDDASKDDTPKIIKDISEKDAHVRIIKLEENMGQYSALFEGYKRSLGRIVISLDDDAFEEIEYIPQFIAKIEEGYDAVFGWRNKKGYPLLRKSASFLFNLAISLVLGMRIHDLGSSLKAKNRKVVDRLISVGDLTCFLRYYKYYKITEIRIPSTYSRSFPTRYGFIKLIKSAGILLKNNIIVKSKQNTPCRGNKHLEKARVCN